MTFSSSRPADARCAQWGCGERDLSGNGMSGTKSRWWGILLLQSADEGALTCLQTWKCALRNNYIWAWELQVSQDRCSVRAERDPHVGEASRAASAKGCNQTSLQRGGLESPLVLPESVDDRLVRSYSPPRTGWWFARSQEEMLVACSLTQFQRRSHREGGRGAGAESQNPTPWSPPPPATLPPAFSPKLKVWPLLGHAASWVLMENAIEVLEWMAQSEIVEWDSFSFSNM